MARHPRPQQARCHPDRARRARGRGRGVRLPRGRKCARQARHGAQAHGRGRGVRHDVRRGLYDDCRIRRIPRAPEKRRSVPDVHLLLPGVGEVSRKREPQVFEEHFDLQVADGDGRRDLPRQVCREGRCRRPHDLSHRHHALHGEEDGGRAPRVHPRRSTRRRPCAHHARGDRYDAGDRHPALRAGAGVPRYALWPRLRCRDHLRHERRRGRGGRAPLPAG